MSYSGHPFHKQVWQVVWDDTINKPLTLLVFILQCTCIVQSWGLIRLWELTSYGVKGAAAAKRKGMLSLLLEANAGLGLYLTSLQPWGSSQWATVCVKVPFVSDNCTLRFHSPYLECQLSPLPLCCDKRWMPKCQCGSVSFHAFWALETHLML